MSLFTEAAEDIDWPDSCRRRADRPLSNNRLTDHDHVFWLRRRNRPGNANRRHRRWTFAHWASASIAPGSDPRRLIEQHLVICSTPTDNIHYNDVRTHLSLTKDAPIPRAAQRVGARLTNLGCITSSVCPSLKF